MFMFMLCYATVGRHPTPSMTSHDALAPPVTVAQLYNTGRAELKLREDRRKYTRAQAVMGAASAVIECVKAD
jgi:hypothetical protein